MFDIIYFILIINKKLDMVLIIHACLWERANSIIISFIISIKLKLKFFIKNNLCQQCLIEFGG